MTYHVTREELADLQERYRRRNEAEREGAMAERKQRNDREDTLRWCEERNEQKRLAEQAERDRKPERDRSKMPNSSELWGTWVDQRIQASEKTLLAAIGDVLADERLAHRKAVDELRRENDMLRQELAVLKTEVAELRGELRVRSAIDGVESRLAKLEVPLARLKAAS